TEASACANSKRAGHFHVAVRGDIFIDQRQPFANKELLARVRDALARQPGSRSIQKPVTQLLIVGTDLGVVGTLQITISTRFSVDSAWTLPEALERLKSPSYVAIVL